MGHFSPEMLPEHFNRIKPSAISRQVEQDQTTCCGPNDCFDFLILVSDGVVSGHKNRTARMFLHQGLQQLSDFQKAFLFRMITTVSAVW
jgi:hypothetical protein